jgi:putative sterol carrier protein
MKESSLSNGLDMLLTMPSLAVAMAQPLIWGLAPLAFSVIAHTWCTNVAGPQIPVYLRGHKLLENYGFFPLNPSMGLACVIVSYNQKISMNLMADKAIVDDVTTIRDYLRDSFLALRSAAKVQPMEPISIDKPARTTSSNNRTAPVSSSSDDGVVVKEEVSVEIAEDAQPEEVSEPVEEPSDEPLRIFTDPWAKAYKEAINDNPDYYRTSTRWTAGPLAFVMEASARHGYPERTAVILDLHKGKCRAARALTPAEAYEEASFVIEGTYDNWQTALRGEAKPLTMLIRGKLKLKKGALTRLMPFTQSAQELINSAQRI